MKTVTCAMVMINGDGDILGCHGTEKPIENGYDFPKGCRDADDYVIIKGYWMWKQYGIKVDIDIDYYINEIRNERDKRK